MKTLLSILLMLPFCTAAQHCVWAKQATNSVDNTPSTIVADAAGNVYVAGYFRNSITFGTVVLSDPDTIGANAFIVKYNASGSVLWTKNFSDSLGDYAY